MDLEVDQGNLRSRWSLIGGPAELGLSPVVNISSGEQRLARLHSGRIVTKAGRLETINGRWWPYFGNMLRVWWDQNSTSAGDICELFFHVPWSSPQFVTLDYVRSGQDTSLSTFYAATLVLDEIARLKRSAGLVCNVTNDRISPRLMTRWGWEQHCMQWSGRHYIKRFYGNYPDISTVWRQRLTMSPARPSLPVRTNVEQCLNSGAKAGASTC